MFESTRRFWGVEGPEVDGLETETWLAGRSPFPPAAGGPGAMALESEDPRLGFQPDDAEGVVGVDGVFG